MDWIRRPPPRTLAAAAYFATEKLAGRGEVWEGEDIRDVDNHLFAAYIYRISDIARRKGSSQTDNVDMADLVENRELSDEGAFLQVLENGICGREFLNAMPPKGGRAAIARNIFGYSWQETAGTLSSSVNAARPQLHSLRQAPRAGLQAEVSYLW